MARKTTASKTKTKKTVDKEPAKKKAAPAKTTKKPPLASKAKSKAKPAAKAAAKKVVAKKVVAKKVAAKKVTPKKVTKPVKSATTKANGKAKSKANTKAKAPAKTAAKKPSPATTKAASKSGVKVKPLTLMIATRKGAFYLRSDATRDSWKISKPEFLGHIVYHMVSDPRGSKVVVMGSKTGHLGPTVMRSTDNGATWTEATRPPAFTKHEWEEKGRAVENVFWIAPGHESEPGVWYAGTSPPGLFRSEDDGDTWHSVTGFNEHHMYGQWIASGGATPGGQMVHSIRIDPRDPNHMYLAISVGGVFESHDKGHDWHPLNKGCQSEWLPDPDVEYGHDPHCFIFHPLNPDRLYQQNHCGIYKMERSEGVWERIGDNMPKAVGDIGFPIVAHPEDPDCVWVFPMDGTTVWPRTSPEGKPCTYISRNGGKTWKKQSKGLPESDAYFTVKRQAMTCDHRKPLGLYFGTSGGEVWGSADEGESWQCLVRYLPEIYSVTVLED